jgi:hypothetical protein
MINVIHKECGQVAFYFRKRLYRGESIHCSNVVKIDGSIPNHGEHLICGKCGSNLYHLGSHNIEQKEQHWTDWFIIDKVPE